MYKAINSKGEVVSIEQIEKNENYKCPFCHSEMITKMGKIKIHHFAHKNRIVCDEWYSENKGEWHRGMQKLFKKEYQEVIIYQDDDKRTGVFHIADICIPKQDGTKLIIEFQHSPISVDEFLKRTVFYLGKEEKPNTLIWIFDFRDKEMRFYKNPKCEKNEINIKWKWASKIFTYYNFKNNWAKKIKIVFYVQDKNWTPDLEKRKEYYQSHSFEDIYDNCCIYVDRLRRRYTNKGKPFFIIPKEPKENNNWSSFYAKIENENIFFDWARKI